MRYHLIFTLPYVILLVIIIFVTGKLQQDQKQIETVAERDCVVQKKMYAIISHSLRSQAAIERSISPSKNQGNAPALRAKALLLEASEADDAALSLPNCLDRPLQAHSDNQTPLPVSQ